MIKFIIAYGLIIYWGIFFLISIVFLGFIIITLARLTKTIIKEEEMAKIEPDYVKHTDKTIYKSSHIPIPQNIKRKRK
jgi:hypothetical protein